MKNSLNLPETWARHLCSPIGCTCSVCAVIGWSNEGVTEPLSHWLEQSEWKTKHESMWKMFQLSTNKQVRRCISKLFVNSVYTHSRITTIFIHLLLFVNHFLFICGACVYWFVNYAPIICPEKGFLHLTLYFRPLLLDNFLGF